jgi:hypothetical protein
MRLMNTTTFPNNSSSTDVLGALELRLAGPGDREALGELAKRWGGSVPNGGLMLAVAGDRVIAAVSMTTGEALAEDTPDGSGAVAVLRYTAGHLKPARPRPRRHGSPS